MRCDVSVLKIMFEHLAGIMSKNKQDLIALDSVMGDSDLGLTMEKIFSEAHQKIKDSDEVDVGKFLFKIGMIMADAAPSTMGTLMASGFMQAGKTLKGKTELGVSDWVLFVSSFRDGVAGRGKAKVGEKTILDVLEPVAKGLESRQTSSLKELFEFIVNEAGKALENTKTLKAQHGRAAYYGDKSIGHVDAGATVAYLMYSGMHECLGGYYES